ncbi:MAG: aldo/keto reductase [Succinivibrionaceae bacterium]|nr:aldo/keto reductase [Succinivibrionaceae bacterium]
MEKVQLSEGVAIDRLTFGTYRLKDPGICREAVLMALSLGCRSIDTAAIYGNEAAVGEAIAQSGVPRGEITLTTKLWTTDDGGHDRTLRAVDRQMGLLGVDYLDLMLIHHCVGDCHGSYRALEELHGQGAIRALGVSNFAPDRLVDLTLCCQVRPALLQIEVNPFYQQHHAIATARRLGVMVQAWAPLAEGKGSLFTHHALSAIGERHGRTAAQVALNWLRSRGLLMAVRATSEEHLREDLGAFGFTLTGQDLAEIEALDTGMSTYYTKPWDEVVEATLSHHLPGRGAS